jgi:hypothetical protein
MGPAYQRRREELEQDLELAGQDRVPEDGDCVYSTFLELFPDQFTRVFGYRPTVGELRGDLLARMEADWADADLGVPAGRMDSFFPGTVTGPEERRQQARNEVRAEIRTLGAWDSDAGDRVPGYLALAYGLRATLLGPRYPLDLGPAEGAPAGYAWYTGSHYTAARPAGRVLTARQLLPELAELDALEPSAMTPADVQELAALEQDSAPPPSPGSGHRPGERRAAPAPGRAAGR